jgi:adenosylmethionine-8-amino-7-oxononanoate aminotransferase
MTTEQLRQLDQQHLWHPFTPMKLWMDSDPLVIVAGEGMHLIDSDGNRYLDGVSSLWCNVHGHRVAEIDAAVRAQLDKIAHTTMLGLASEPAILLADRLMRIVPAGLTKVFYSDAGATATEIAFKMAAQYWFNIGRPEKNEFVGFADAYHGDTVGAMSIGRMEAFHKPYFPLLFKTHFAKANQIESLKAILAERSRQIAAICIEPVVQGAGGMLIQPPGFLREVRKLADEHDVLLICDEVATGFGRTGRMFACEHEGVSPDIMCTAKGITGGYLPLAATFATQRIFDAFLGEPWEGKTFYHGHTYTGNPLGCAAALATLERLARSGAVEAVPGKARVLREALAGVEAHPHVGEVRQSGLMCGVELVADRATRARFPPGERVGYRIGLALRAHGIFARPLGDVVVLMPPLSSTDEELRGLGAALHAVLVERFGG